MTLPLLIVRHAEWEGPHRILAAFPGVQTVLVDPLATPDHLPAPSEVQGAIFMGGPMSVNDTERHPRLAEEVSWIQEALAVELPILGVCLGSQLIAKALGAEIVPGPRPEVGYAPIDILDPADPLLGELAPSATVLHWHGERFDLPPGATLLARSALTPVQAFRAGSAWGLLFHAEADSELVHAWLAEPAMSSEAHAALGDDYELVLHQGAASTEDALGDPVFRAFARRCEDHSAA